MAGYSTYGIMNSKELSPEQKIELLKEQQRNSNNVSMLRTAQDTNWDTMLGYGLGKMARSMYDNYQSRNAFKEQEILRRKEAGEKLPEGSQNWTAQQWKDYNAQQNAVQPTGETTQSVSFNPKTGTIGMEKTENFSGGLLGNMPGVTPVAEQFKDQQFMQNLLGNLPAEKTAALIDQTPKEQLFGEFKAPLQDVAKDVSTGAGEAAKSGGMSAGSIASLAGNLLGNEDLAKAGQLYSKGEGLIRGLAGDPTGWIQLLLG